MKQKSLKFALYVEKKSRILVHSSPGNVRIDYTINPVTHQAAHFNVSESYRD